MNSKSALKVAFALSLLVAPAVAAGTNMAASSRAPVTRTESEASYETTDLESAYRDADLVARVVIRGVDRTWVDKVPTSSGSVMRVPGIGFRADVTDVIKGESPPDGVVIGMVGGDLDGEHIERPGTPLFRAGDEAYVFLLKVSPAPPYDEAYVVLGGPLGRYPVVDGRVFSMDSDAEWLPTKFDGVTPASFRATVEEAGK